MPDIIEQLMKANLRIDRVNERLQEVGKILMHPEKDLEIITPKFAGFAINDTIELVTIFQNENISITYGIWRKKNHTMPEHVHHDSIEHLICSNGSVCIEHSENKFILSKGDCLTIPKGIFHTATSLEDNSVLFGICIPPEQAFTIKDYNG